MKGSVMDWIAGVLMLVGCLNWGLVGLNSFGVVSYDWDLVNLLLGGMPWLAAIVYLLVALSGIWIFYKMSMMK